MCDYSQLRRLNLWANSGQNLRTVGTILCVQKTATDCRNRKIYFIGCWRWSNEVSSVTGVSWWGCDANDCSDVGCRLCARGAAHRYNTPGYIVTSRRWCVVYWTRLDATWWRRYCSAMEVVELADTLAYWPAQLGSRHTAERHIC